MNKKGFTLVELLGVIVLLAALTLIAVPAVNKTIRDGKKNADKANYDVVFNAAYDYILKNNVAVTETETRIKVEDLIKEGYIKSDTTDGSGRLLSSDQVGVIKVRYQTGNSEDDSGKIKYFGSYKFIYYVSE